MSKWKRISLDKLCNFDKGKTGLAKAVEGEFPLITTGADRKSSNEYQFDTKAVCIPLVSSTGHGHASINYIHYQEGKFALGTILVALTAKNENEINMKFLHLYLSKLKDSILVPLMTGAANVSLSISKIKKVEIPLPPIDEQDKIVKLFESIIEEQQDLIIEISNQENLLSKLKQSILQEAIEGKLTAKWREENQDIEPASVLLKKIQAEKEQLIKEKKIKNSKTDIPITQSEIPYILPSTWAWCRLENIVSLYNGSIRRGPFGSAITKDMFVSQAEDTYKVYEQKNAIQKNAELGDYYITDKHYQELKNFSVKSGDIIISCAGTIGETFILPENIQRGIINQALLKININNTILFNEYFLYLFSALTKKQVNDDATGSAMKNMVSLNYLKSNVYFPIPPLEEQKEIINKVKKLFAICDELEEQINNSKQNTQTLMQAVLKEAFER